MGNKRCSLLSGCILCWGLLLLGRFDRGLGVIVFVLGLVDLDVVGHDLLFVSNLQLGALHDLYLKTENTLTELNGTDSRVNEIVLGLTSGNLITLSIFLGLGSLTTNLTSDNDLATDGLTTSHDGTEDVVSSHTDGSTIKKLELEGLDISSGAKVLVIRDWFYSKIDLVILIVEVISLLDERLDLLDLTGGFFEELLLLGGTNTNFSVDAGGTDLNTGITLHTKSLLEELVEFSLENTIGNELLLGVDLHLTIVCHSDYLLLLL